MKKVLLVTLQGANHGNRLQNYALQECIKKIGYEVYNPYYTPEEYSTLYKRLKYAVKSLFGCLGVKKFKYILQKKKKEKVFNEFNEQWIDNRFWIDFKKTRSLSNYDYGVTGSDQVWHNWTKTVEELKYFYLFFIDKSKRISYAASFGFLEFNQDQGIHKEGLLGIEKLSCREEHGAQIINNLTKRKATVVPDPTLLLNKEDWEFFEERPGYKINNNFVLVYFLGTISDSAIEIIKEIKEDGIQIINLTDSEENYYLATPNNFVWLVHNAESIITDSFHACVFSVIFRKKFLVFNRIDKYLPNMFDRIETLLKIMNLEDRQYKYGASYKKIKAQELNEKEIESTIKKQQKIGYEYLKSALSLKF